MRAGKQALASDPAKGRARDLLDGAFDEMKRVEGLLSRCGFASDGLFVMDGSRRSAHGNAYFTGLGAAKGLIAGA